MRLIALMLLIGAACGADNVRRLDRLADTVEVATTAGARVTTSDRVLADLPTASPLTTLLDLGRDQPSGVTVSLALDIPAEAGALGLGFWRRDIHGRWFQHILPGMLEPGRHQRTVTLDGQAPLVTGRSGGVWTPAAAEECRNLGLLLYGTGKPGALVRVDAQVRPSAPPVVQLVPQLVDLVCAAPTTSTGRRWSLAVRPDPYPADPFDPAVFRLDLVVTGPDGNERRFAGFHDQPMERRDRGDREEFTAVGRPTFRVRFRPQQPGVHRLRLEARWQDGATRTIALPEVTAQGAPWDDMVRIDAKDQRFFSVNGAFFWPLGQNLHSTYDTRCRDRLGTKLTPERGSFVREAMLARLAANGGTAAEVWLAPWNLCLEWVPRWSGFQGAGRFHEGNAWALDQLIDQAERLGVRIQLSIFNHGMGREGERPEEDWRWHPYNKVNGGWLDRPAQLFTDPRARVQQERYFRYLAARVADSPALLGWKLWAEINLTHASDAVRQGWHVWAAEALRRNDPWRHPITTHWSRDWTKPDPVIAAQKGLEYLTIDAYHQEGTTIADLLAASVHQVRNSPTQPQKGIGRFAKPVFVAEYGGAASPTSNILMEAEHAIGPWVGLMTGHAAAPMLWWFEWVDQGDRYAPYRALSAFIAGEDLRGREADTASLVVSYPQRIWSRVWNRPGRILGYLLDYEWGRMEVAGERPAVSGARVRVKNDMPPARLQVQWWDADQGVIIKEETLAHPGGNFDLHPPDFRRHLAFKLWRLGDQAANRR